MGTGENLGEKLKGVAKEAMGKVMGDEDREREGEAQQMKAQRDDEADRLADEARAKRQQAAGYEGEQRKHQD